MINNTKKPTSSIKEVLKIMDRTLGSFTALIALSILIYNQINDLGFTGPILIFSFLLFNLILTQISIKLPSVLHVELFRHLVALTVFCPLGLVLVKGPFEPFWYLYLIMIVSSSSIFFEVTGKHTTSIIVTFYGLVNYMITSYLFLPEISFISTAINCWIMAMVGLLMYYILKLVDQSFRNEIHRRSQLQKTLKELESTQQTLIHSSRLSAIGEMAGGIAHEINNPLTIISGSVFRINNELRSKTLSDEELIKNLNRISKTVDRITRIVSGLSIVSRDSKTTKRQKTLLKDILEDALVICREKFKFQGIDLQLNLDSKEFETTVNVDRVQLSQALLNLLSNSYDAIENQKNAWIKIETYEDGDMQVLKIIDSGEGISKEDQEKIFEPFFTTKEVGKGTGLGLSISKSILEKNQGQLALDTNAKNTTLILKMPKA